MSKFSQSFRIRQIVYCTLNNVIIHVYNENKNMINFIQGTKYRSLHMPWEDLDPMLFGFGCVQTFSHDIGCIVSLIEKLRSTMKHSLSFANICACRIWKLWMMWNGGRFELPSGQRKCHLEFCDLIKALECKNVLINIHSAKTSFLQDA